MREFVYRVSWGASDFAALAFTVLAAVWYASAWFYPASDWIEIKEITVSDARVGYPILMTVDRELYRGTDHGRYTVEVRSYPSKKSVCIAQRKVPYVEGTLLDKAEPVTLKWWAYSNDGQCERWTPKPGQYFVTTQHCWRGAWWAREACNKVTTSNVFTITREE